MPRLSAGKTHHAKLGKRVNGRYSYGEHPLREYDSERMVVERIRKMHSEGVSLYAVAEQLNAEVITTRYGHKFWRSGIRNILRRVRC
ncbi:MAG: recombinase family protein [Candidatus Sulfotelmatobacter sp.]